MSGLVSLALALALAAAPGAKPGQAKAPVQAPSTDEEAFSETARRATGLWAAGTTKAAIQVLEAARRRFDKEARLHGLLGVLYRQTRQIAKAERALRRAIALDPKDALARADLAAVLEQRGAYAEALTTINRAASLRPHDGGIRADRAVIRFRLGQTAAAIEDMIRATRRLPDDPALALDYALMLLVRGQSGDPAKAAEILQRARRHDPDSATLRLTHGLACLAAGKTTPGLLALDGLLASNPRLAWANWGRGLAAFRERDHEAARIYGVEARKVLPQVFTVAGFDKHRFFSRDAQGYLRWLDDTLGVPGNTVRATASRAPRAVLERLTLGGGCRRKEVKPHLENLRGDIAACFGGKRGRISASVTLVKGRAESADRLDEGMTPPVDRCVLRVLKKATYPKVSCSLRMVWGVGSRATRPALPYPTVRGPAAHKPR